MEEFNSLYYAIIDSNDRYYSSKEIKPHLDIKIIHESFSYDKSEDIPIENKKTSVYYLRDCVKEDFNKH